VRQGDDARQLHAGANRGPMLAAAYWCEGGCRGRIELLADAEKSLLTDR